MSNDHTIWQSILDLCKEEVTVQCLSFSRETKNIWLSQMILLNSWAPSKLVNLYKLLNSWWCSTKAPYASADLQSLFCFAFLSASTLLCLRKTCSLCKELQSLINLL